MEQEPYKVSILVPVYGVENYIERCARSLFEQSYQNIEFVFVNDCTKDNGIKILLKTLEEYPRRRGDFKLIEHKINRGIAATRNTALAECKGDFFMFVDSDDWIEHDTVERMVKAQLKYDCDIVTCNYKIYETKGVCQHKEQLLPTTKEMLKQILDGKGNGRLWGRLIRTSLIKENNIHFVEGANFAEDIMVMSFLWFYATNHSDIDDFLYNYERRNTTSYTNSFSIKNSLESLRNLDETREFFRIHAPEYKDSINLLELGKVSGHMCLCCKNRKNKQYYNSELLRRLDVIDKKYWNRIPLKNRVAIYLRNFELVRIYMKVGGIINQILKK